VVDTRNPTGAYGAPPLAANSVRTFDLAGQCGIAPDAGAVSLNVTVSQPTDAGYLTLFAGGAEIPSSSTMNYRAGQTRANNAVIRLGPGGALAVYCAQSQGTTELIIDVNGFFR
jgi:hypothetical protein